MTDIACWLAFDIGTSATKAALLTRAHDLLGSAGSAYPSHQQPGGVVEQEPGDWWRAVQESCRELGQRCDLSQAEAISVSGQMQNLILVAGSEPLRPALLYSDTRAQAEAAEVVERLGRGLLQGRTGNEQGADGLLAKLLWLARHEPDRLREAERLLLGAADFVALQMTGVAAGDTTTASTTGLLDLPRRQPHEAAIFERLDLAMVPRLLPPLQPGGAEMGRLSDEAARALGLRPGLPVHLGPGDAGAATLGAGCGEEGSAYGYVGSSGWIAFSAHRPADPERGAITLVHPHPERFIQVAPLMTAGGNLQWVRRLFQQDRYQELIERALERPPARLLYLPYLNGERAPFRDPNARGAFIGLSPDSHREDLYRAVLEGVAFAYRHALEALIPGGIAGLALTGGGTRSGGWNQLFADILGTPVDALDDAENAGVRGAVLAAQAARGERRGYAAPARSSGRRFLPSQAHRSLYDQRYGLFRELHHTLRATFAGLAADVNRLGA